MDKDTIVIVVTLILGSIAQLWAGWRADRNATAEWERQRADATQQRSWEKEDRAELARKVVGVAADVKQTASEVAVTLEEKRLATIEELKESISQGHTTSKDEALKILEKVGVLAAGLTADIKEGTAASKEAQKEANHANIKIADTNTQLNKLHEHLIKKTDGDTAQKLDDIKHTTDEIKHTTDDTKEMLIRKAEAAK